MVHTLELPNASFNITHATAIFQELNNPEHSTLLYLMKKFHVSNSVILWSVQNQHQVKNLEQTRCSSKAATLWHTKIANGTYTRTSQCIIQHHTCYSRIPKIEQPRTFYSAILNGKISCQKQCHLVVSRETMRLHDIRLNNTDPSIETWIKTTFLKRHNRSPYYSPSLLFTKATTVWLSASNEHTPNTMSA